MVFRTAQRLDIGSKALALAVGDKKKSRENPGLFTICGNFPHFEMFMLT